METYTCEGSCDTRDCDDMCHVWDAAEDYQCTRSRGHTGPHVACSSEECNVMEWGSKNRKRVPLTKEVGALGPITITIGPVEVSIPHHGITLVRAEEQLPAAYASLTPDELKRLIRALVMAANLQRADNPKKCDVCGGGGYQYDECHPIMRCDSCEQFDSDYAAWLAIIPDESRLSSEDEDDE